VGFRLHGSLSLGVHRPGETSMSFRVIQWYTGSIAREQIRMIQHTPELELVGAVVHHEEKAGIDIGVITKSENVGVTTVGNIDDGLAIQADVVLYNAPFERYDEIIRILESGKNVITPSAAFFSFRAYPKTCYSERID